MNPVIIKEYRLYREAELLDLYKSVGWSTYYDRPDMLRQAFSHSLCILGAYAGEKLVGLVRAVGDGATIVFLQDILVHPAYQRRRIGTRLIGELLDRYRHVRQLHLLTDDQPGTVGFYKAAGFTPVEDVHFRAFTRLRY